jgi:hypothetical protein
MVRIGLTTFRVFEFVRKCLCDDLWGSWCFEQISEVENYFISFVTINSTIVRVQYKVAW